MKQTIFNASLEESMNLVTDKYIKTSLEDFKEKGYGKKILGFFTVYFLMFLIVLLAFTYDEKNITLFFINISFIEIIVFILGFFVIAYYLNNVRKIKEQQILSYYYFNQSMFFMSLLFIIQLIVFCLASSDIVSSDFLLSLAYVVLYVLFIVKRVHQFRQKTFEVLYVRRQHSNPLVNILNQFVSFSQKYAWLIIILLFFLRMFFPSEYMIRQNSMLNSVIDLFIPLVGLPFLLFSIALGTDNFQGYYLQKYLEDYRKLSGYSIEEWYGKDSQRYKESLNQKD
ncbi:hypothetical protein [Streptococcus sanguinis]|uniref:hypothetical protein n=1 Tax=Streptococcus sanguinis TaxID=1305 RepID=UPI00228535D1|nr:hypothetical protein [Streptococcus sanguinis]MCY7011874.1 hypothetical protein [Streptococcus sanguinis]